MRLRHTSPLLLFLAPSLVRAQLNVLAADGSNPLAQNPVEVLTNEEILALNHAPKNAQAPGTQTAKALLAEATSSASTTLASSSTKRYVGTEDAPVDGLDGKPHAGPFVDTTPEEVNKKGQSATATKEKTIPTSLKKFEASSEDGWKLADIPEKNDGVMNDENRQIPKKGTTGTEGGISEKEKLKGTKIGEEKEPQAPKEAPPLPHSEEQHIEKAEEAATEKAGDKDKSDKGKAEKGKAEKGNADKKPNTPTKDSKDAVTGKAVDTEKKAGDYGAGGHLLEKPKDLPETPHNIPHPDPKVATTPGNGPPVADSTSKTNRPPQSKSATSGSTAPHDPMDWHEWVHSFVLSFTMIIFSEIGDKTFLVAALMAMRHARWVVFSAALSALIAMTILSAVLGHAFPTLLPRRFTTFAAAILFFVFGAKSLREGLAMDKDAGMGEEMKEVEAELEEKEHAARRHSRAEGAGMSAHALESGRGRATSKVGLSPPPTRSPSPRGKDRFSSSGLTNLLSLVLSPAWVQTFIMTFLGEWGDRSQIATIAMAAGQDYAWVTLGAILGHACCTGLAVLGGRALAGRVSMRVVTIGGAIAFLVFGVIYLYEAVVG